MQELAGPDGLTPTNLAQFTVDDLRPVGLSPQKASYLADLAGKVNDGTVHLRQIGRLSDERTVDHLTQLKGIGRWTAQIVLVFSLGPTCSPRDDLGVRTAARNLWSGRSARQEHGPGHCRSLATLRLGGMLVLLAVAGYDPKYGHLGQGYPT